MRKLLKIFFAFILFVPPVIAGPGDGNLASSPNMALSPTISKIRAESNGGQDPYAYLQMYKDPKVREQKLQEQWDKDRNAVPTASQQVAAYSGVTCIHISEIGVNVAVKSLVKKYRANLSPAGQTDIVDEAMYEFYRNYDVADAKICHKTIWNMCKIILTDSMLKNSESEFVTKCKDIKAQLAYTMQFPASCNGKGGNCDKQFADGIKVQPREGKGLVELWTQVKQPNKSVYCSNNIKTRNNQDYLGCKLTDGTSLWNYEFEFDSLDKSIDSSIRESVIQAGVPILWPNKPINIIDTGSYNDKKAIVTGVSGDACTKYNKNINDIFGGYAKATANGCESMWHPEHMVYAKHDFDANDFGTSFEVFRELQIKNVNELDILFTTYLTNKAEQRGKYLTNVHCDKTPGDLSRDTEFTRNFENWEMFKDHYKYIRCYGTYNDKVLTEDFIFTDTSEANTTRANAGLSGFKCVTKNGGIFDGEHCSGISRDVCEKEPKTRWDKDLEVCVLEDAELISKWDYARNTTIKWVSTVAGVTIAVVAALPTGGTSIMGVVAALGATTAAVGQGVSQYAQDEANSQIQKVLSMVGPYKSSCERNGEDCDLCVHGLTMGAMAYGSLLNAQNSAATDEALASCASKWVDNDPESFELMASKLQESGIEPERLKDLKSTGDTMMLIGGAVAFAAGLTKLAGFDKIIPDKSPSKIKLFFDKLSDGFNKTKVGQGVKKVTDTKIYEKADFTQQQVRYGRNRIQKLADYSARLERTFGI